MSGLRVLNYPIECPHCPFIFVPGFDCGPNIFETLSGILLIGKASIERPWLA